MLSLVTSHFHKSTWGGRLFPSARTMKDTDLNIKDLGHIHPFINMNQTDSHELQFYHSVFEVLFLAVLTNFNLDPENLPSEYTRSQ